MSYFDDNNDPEEFEGKLAAYSDLFAALSFVFLFLFVITSMKNSVESIYLSNQAKVLRHEKDKIEQNLSDKHQRKLASLSAQVNRLKALYGKEKSEFSLAAVIQKNIEKEIQSNNQERDNLALKIKQLNEENAELGNYKGAIEELYHANEYLKSELDENKKVISEKAAQLDKIELDIKGMTKKISKERNSFKTQLAQKEIEFDKNIKVREKTIANKYEKKIEGLEEKMRKQKKSIISQYENEFQKQKKKVEKEYDKKVEKTVSGIEKQYEKKLARKDKEFDQKVAKIESGLQKKLEDELEKYKSEVLRKNNEFVKEKARLGRTISSLKQEIEKSDQEIRPLDLSKQTLLKSISAELNKELESHGLNVALNTKNGEIDLPFGEVYFNYGSAKLEVQMRNVLDKVFPTFTEIILQDKYKKYIDSIEIIGHASPTYNGKFYNPETVGTVSKKAIQYNMNLSFERANSIFKYAFRNKNLKYRGQPELLKLVKLSGRGYLGINEVDLPNSNGMSAEQYCKDNRCDKLQRAVLKINFY